MKDKFFISQFFENVRDEIRYLDEYVIPYSSIIYTIKTMLFCFLFCTVDYIDHIAKVVEDKIRFS
jgi:5,10-methylenetetrahydrofolate reductase